jgi:hypothetical protein
MDMMPPVANATTAALVTGISQLTLLQRFLGIAGLRRDLDGRAMVLQPAALGRPGREVVSRA